MILSRVVAGNNILNALFMVASAILLMALPALGLSIPQVFLSMAVANALVDVYVYSVVPEFMLRFFAWILAKRAKWSAFSQKAGSAPMASFRAFGLKYRRSSNVHPCPSFP